MPTRAIQVTSETRQKSRLYLLAQYCLGTETHRQLRKAVWGYIFISPWLLGLLLFFGGPIIASLGLSFTEYSLVSPVKFVGLANFSKAFTDDRLFWPSLGRTFYWSFIYVPIVVTGSLEGLSRTEAEQAVKDAGARAANSVSSKTDFVVVGEKPGSKADKARALGIEIIDEAEFRRRLRRGV